MTKGPLLCVVDCQVKFEHLINDQTKRSMQQVIHYFLKGDCPIVWTQYDCYKNGQKEDPLADETSIMRLHQALTFQRQSHQYPPMRYDFISLEQQSGQRGSSGYALCHDLAPDVFNIQNPIIVETRLWDAFYHPHFRALIDQLDDRRIFLIGGWSEFCIHSNAILALHHDLVPYIIHDAVFSSSTNFSQSVLQHLQETCVILSTQQLLNGCYQHPMA